MKNRSFLFTRPKACIVIFSSLIFVLLLASCTARNSVAQNRGEINLDEAISEVAGKLVEKGNLVNAQVMISPHDFYDLQSRLSLPLANLLREKMVAHMNQRGVRVLLPGVDEDRYMILRGTWQKTGNDLSLNMMVMKLGTAGPEAAAADSVTLPLSAVDPKLLVPDRGSWARYLVLNLENNSRDQDRRTLHLRNFKIRRRSGSFIDTDGYFSGWLRTALAESRMFRTLDQQKEIQALQVATIRTRGTRGVRPEAVSLTADLLMAESELKGFAWLHPTEVEIRVQVNDRKGIQLCAASAAIPSDLFPGYVINPPPPPLPPAPTAVTENFGYISANGLSVDLTTTRGEGNPFYHKGEKIRFIIRLNRSAYVYLFDLDAAGKATLLYPVDANGRLVPPQLLAPGNPLVLPEDGSSYELVVSEPFGKDIILAVATESSLTFPPDLSGDWSRSGIIVNRLRQQGLATNRGYAEAQVEIVTGP